jgi:hypothetical protein
VMHDKDADIVKEDERKKIKKYKRKRRRKK